MTRPARFLSAVLVLLLGASLALHPAAHAGGLHGHACWMTVAAPDGDARPAAAPVPRFTGLGTVLVPAASSSREGLLPLPPVRGPPL